jgi:hypothetical protein
MHILLRVKQNVHSGKRDAAGDKPGKKSCFHLFISQVFLLFL